MEPPSLVVVHLKQKRAFGVLGIVRNSLQHHVHLRLNHLATRIAARGRREVSLAHLEQFFRLFQIQIVLMICLAGGQGQVLLQPIVART